MKKKTIIPGILRKTLLILHFLLILNLLTCSSKAQAQVVQGVSERASGNSTTRQTRSDSHQKPIMPRYAQLRCIWCSIGYTQT